MLISRVSLGITLAALTACSASPTPTAEPDPVGLRNPDAGTAADVAPPVVDEPLDPNYPTAHEPLPLVDFQGGQVMVSPKIVTVTFDGDALRARLEEFDDMITSTPWWDAVRDGYCMPGGSPCVGQGAGAGHVALPTQPAANLTDSSQGAPSSIQEMIRGYVADGTFPAPTTDMMYAIYFPSSVSIDLDGSKSCAEFGAYHNTTTVTPPGGPVATVPYAIMPRCTGGEKELTLSASHEIIETATDPGVGVSEIAYYMSNQIWAAAGGGEVADLCVNNGSSAAVLQGTFTVQRSWSNANAAASHDPCVPIPPGSLPYFNLAPAKGQDQVTLKVGDSTTVEFTAFSDGPLAADWDVSLVDYARYQGSASVLSFVLDKTSAHNGSKVHATVTLDAKPSQGYAPYAIVSKSGSQRHVWPAVIIAK